MADLLHQELTGQQVGLLFNFGSDTPQFKRLFRDIKPTQPTPANPETAWPNLLFPEVSYTIIGGLFEVHNQLGPGFIHRIYANACYREMQARGLAVKPLRQITVFYRGKPVGHVKLAHFQIENNIMVFPVAILNTVINLTFWGWQWDTDWYRSHGLARIILKKSVKIRSIRENPCPIKSKDYDRW